MDKELFDQIVAALLPEMGDTDSRRPLVYGALVGSSVLQQIQWGGAARPFTIHLVQRLNDFGRLSSGRPALVALLEEVRAQVGVDRQAEIDRLLAKLNGVAPTPPAGVMAPAKSPEAEKPPVAPGSQPAGHAPPVVAAKVEQTITPAPGHHTEAGRAPDDAVHTPQLPRTNPVRPNILVMKGGGVKGIAYVGALEVLERFGYHFDHFVGTSAGAISAALLAVGYTPQELQEVLASTDFRQFKDGWLPLSIISLWLTKGLYRGDVFTMWLENNLRAKFPDKFSAVPILFKHLKNKQGPPKRLTIFASTKNKTAFRFDSEDPKDQETGIAFACRCSMAIPYFFRPERINGELVFDGGMQNNYPIRALLEQAPALRENRNFIGLYLGPKKAQKESPWAWRTLYSIATEASDEEAKNEFIDHTIVIDPHPVQTTDFSLSKNDVLFLLAEGRASALQWVSYHSEGNRPTSAEIESARKEAMALRALTTNERSTETSKSRRRLTLKLLLFITIIVAITGGLYWHFKS